MPAGYPAASFPAHGAKPSTGFAPYKTCDRDTSRLHFLAMKTLLLVSIVALFALGCATRPRPQPLTQSDIISMVKAGVLDEEIIRRIEGTRTVFRLGSDDVLRLRNEGVSDRVVNFMLDTYTRYVAAAERRQAYYDADWHYGFGFYYGYPHHRYWW